MQETVEVSEAEGRKVKLRNGKKDGRSFKEVVVGTPQHSNVNDWLEENLASKAVPDLQNNGRKVEKLCMKEMIWSLVEEIFNSTNIEKIKQKIGVVFEEAFNAIKGREVAMDVLVDCRKIEEKLQKERGD